MSLYFDICQALHESGATKLYIRAPQRSGKTTAAFMSFQYCTKTLGKIHVLIIAKPTPFLSQLIRQYTSELLTFSFTPGPHAGTLIEWWDEPEGLLGTMAAIQKSEHLVLVTATPTADDPLDIQLREALFTVDRCV
jgi:hypothetical protein